MGSIGTSADNALAEPFNATVKREALKDSKTFENQLLCRRDVLKLVYAFHYHPGVGPNVKVERFNCILMTEWTYAQTYVSEQARQEKIRISSMSTTAIGLTPPPEG